MLPKIERLETIHKGWNTFSIATLRLENGETITRAVEDHGRSAAVLVYNCDRRSALLVRQFRAPIYIDAKVPDLLEVIAGLVDDETPEAAARREALEEAGVALGALVHVGRTWSMPGSSTEQIDLYLAEYRAGDRVAPGGGLDAEQENITVEEIALSHLAAMADDGAIADLKTLALIQSLRLRRPELF